MKSSVKGRKNINETAKTCISYLKRVEGAPLESRGNDQRDGYNSKVD